MRSSCARFTSTHTILHAAGGEFISSLDPLPEYAAAVADCKNIGSWPVLVGDEKKNERDAMLSSPIIFYDYPKIAPESAGDLFDGTEIDEILTLRVQTMTDAEKDEMRQRGRTRAENSSSALRVYQEAFAQDARRDARRPNVERRFLQSSDAGGKLHGRQGVELKAATAFAFDRKNELTSWTWRSMERSRSIEAVEQDVENDVHFALVLEDDPGRELGMMRQPGHRFFYGADEVEP